MTTITREQLELAALAYGIDESWIGNSAYMDGLLSTWCPHLNDGCALRLAAEVGMKITAPRHCGDGASAEPMDGKSRSVTVYRKDRAEQMRIAIVLCAVAVGERMKAGLDAG